MPNENGEEFIEHLREFDKQTIVILQTGYAGEKTQLEMTKQLNIQWYYDKMQRVDMLVSLLYSAIKYIVLLKEVKYCEQQKHIRDLKDKFFASRIKAIHSEIRNPLMLLGGSTLGVETYVENNELNKSEKEFLLKQVDYSKKGTMNIFESIEALDIASESVMTVQALINKIKLLLDAEILKKWGGVKRGNKCRLLFYRFARWIYSIYYF